MPAWIEGTVIGVNANRPGEGGGGGYGGGPMVGAGAVVFGEPSFPNEPIVPANQWTTISLANVVPPGTKAVELNAILIITHGSQPSTADLQVGFKRTGAAPTGNYQWQCVEGAAGGGQRSTASCWVPLDENLCFDLWWWFHPQPGPWPDYSAYRANVFVNAYLR
jgi:hypothetical protein